MEGPLRGGAHYTCETPGCGFLISGDRDAQQQCKRCGQVQGLTGAALIAHVAERVVGRWACYCPGVRDTLRAIAGCEASANGQDVVKAMCASHRAGRKDDTLLAAYLIIERQHIPDPCETSLSGRRIAEQGKAPLHLVDVMMHGLHLKGHGLTVSTLQNEAPFSDEVGWITLVCQPPYRKAEIHNHLDIDGIQQNATRKGYDFLYTLAEVPTLDDYVEVICMFRMAGSTSESDRHPYARSSFIPGRKPFSSGVKRARAEPIKSKKDDVVE